MNHNSGGCSRAGRHRRGAGRVLTAFALVVAACRSPPPARAPPPSRAAVRVRRHVPVQRRLAGLVDGGHFWDASGNGLCRIDADAAAPSGFSENAATCDVQAKKPTQAVVDPKTMSTTSNYSVYSADMSSKSGGPLSADLRPDRRQWPRPHRAPASAHDRSAA